MTNVRFVRANEELVSHLLFIVVSLFLIYELCLPHNVTGIPLLVTCWFVSGRASLERLSFQFQTGRAETRPAK